jgi:hypothetical protein
MIKFLLKKFLRRLKYWGCEFEYNIPPEFVISDHAEQRLKERFKCGDHKLKKVTVKAWYSNEFVDKSKIKDNGRIYRSFNGNVFVFKARFNKRIMAEQKILVTVINPKLVNY